MPVPAGDDEGAGEVEATGVEECSFLLQLTTQTASNKIGTAKTHVQRDLFFFMTLPMKLLYRSPGYRDCSGIGRRRRGQFLFTAADNQCTDDEQDPESPCNHAS